MFLIENMFKKMMNIWLNISVLTQDISLMIEIGHQSSYNRKSKFMIHLWHRPTQHCCCTRLTIWSTYTNSEKPFWNFSNKLIVSQTDMIVFGSRWLLITTRLCNLWSINNSLNIWIDDEIFTIYLVVSMSDNNFQAMTRKTVC